MKRKREKGTSGGITRAGISEQDVFENYRRLRIKRRQLEADQAAGTMARDSSGEDG